MDFVRSTLIEMNLSTDLEKNGGQKCSTGQRFIFTEVTFYKIHILAKGSVLVLCTKFNVQIGAGRHVSHPC
jgi:hypothetical protein